MRNPRTRSSWWPGVLLSFVLAGACSDEPPDAASEPAPETVATETPAEPTETPPAETPTEPTEPLLPSRVEPRVLDLPQPELSLGMPVRQARPSLTAGCISNHYAERLGDRFLRLSCLTELAPWPRRLRLAFLESDTAPTRLAYHIVETTLPHAEAGALWAHLLDDAHTAFGSPDLVDTDTHAVWTGTGRDGQATMLELQLLRDTADGDVVVQQAWRHRPLVAQLGLPR